MGPASLNLESCHPSIDGMDWRRLSETDFVFAGAGAGNRPLAKALAYLGMKRAVIVDAKRYKEASVGSQCDPHEVGGHKAEIVAAELRGLGVDAEGIVSDVNDIEPGCVGPNAMLVTCVDDRRGDVGANRLAVMMAARLVKLNVEPLFMTASLRCLDLSVEHPKVCLECAMSEAQYAAQRHPASCDGGGPERPTGSPRALSQLAAGAAALAIAQIVCAPAGYGKQWLGRQWQLNLLSGRATWSDLPANPNCKCDHGKRWRNLTRLGTGPEQTTLAELMTVFGPDPAKVKLRFSAPVTTRCRCARCGMEHTQVYWARDLTKPVANCACGSVQLPVPFWTRATLPAKELRSRWLQRLWEWGVPSRAIIAVEREDQQRSFVIGK
jgi:hypothetical protein